MRAKDNPRYATALPDLEFEDQFGDGGRLTVITQPNGLAGGWRNPYETPLFIRASYGDESVPIGLSLDDVIRLHAHLGQIIADAGEPLPPDFWDSDEDDAV